MKMLNILFFNSIYLQKYEILFQIMPVFDYFCGIKGLMNKYITKINVIEYHSPVGDLILGESDGRLCLCDWRSRFKCRATEEYVEQGSGVLLLAMNQLEEYFNRERTAFDIELNLIGTSFIREVWSELLRIPYGKAVSYRQIAANIGNERAVRAVANAIGANRISIIVPCHRVLSHNGTIGGYRGGIEAKRQLLELERMSLPLGFVK